MGTLEGYRKNLQVLADVIKFTLGFEVFVVDRDMTAVAGTGPYRVNIGTRRPRDSYVDVTLRQGDDQVVTEPRHTHQCYRCEYRRVCPYAMVMCYPLAHGGEVKGLIGFLAFSEAQRRALLERASLLSGLSGKARSILAGGTQNLQDFLHNPWTRKFLDSFEEPLLLTTPDFRPLNMNAHARGILGSEADLGDERAGPRSALPSEPQAPGKAPLEATLRRKGLTPEVYPLSGETPSPAHLVILSRKSTTSVGWRGCPLSPPPTSALVGESPAIVKVREQILRVGLSDSKVLIMGETGVGKELVARSIHAVSNRRDRPFVTLNSAAIPESLFESEIFGYAPGAFSGALGKGKVGRFQSAHTGTLLLDEIARLSLINQAKILRVLEDGVVQRLGEEGSTRVDVRILAATHGDLEKAVAQSLFLPDLYYRLAVVTLHLPPLRERREDIPLLAAHFVLEMRNAFPKSTFGGFSPRTMRLLFDYSWPGNVRELRNTVEYAMNMVEKGEAEPEHLPPSLLRRPDTPAPLPPVCRANGHTLADLAKEQIRTAIARFGPTVEGKRQAARHLGISLSSLYRRLARMERGRGRAQGEQAPDLGAPGAPRPESAGDTRPKDLEPERPLGGHPCVP